MNLMNKQNKQIAIELVIASLIVLFQELTLIRWMSGQVRVLAYFPNLILLSAFLGLGLGSLQSGKKSLLWLWPLSLLILTGAVIFMSGIIFTQKDATEHLWLLYYDLPKDALVIPNVKIPIILSFLLSTVSFISLGQIVAERIQQFRIQSDTLLGYIYNICGSLFGVVIFSLLSVSGIFPVYWFAFFLILGLLFFKKEKRLNLIYMVSGIVVLFAVSNFERADIYSPYYSLSMKSNGNGEFVEVLSNGSFHQLAVNLKKDIRPKNDYHKKVIEGYHFPFKNLKNDPKTALVLGGGTGNDVATLLDQGLEQVDVVEIDPVILEWGRKFHPNRPYNSSKVNIINTDARSFLNDTKKTYDLIVFGTLDSMTRLSALSNVRLDNFVYTVESIVAAKRRLNPDGGLILYFMVGAEYIDLRLTIMLTEAFGVPPVIYAKHHNLFNRIYMAGPAFNNPYLGKHKFETDKFKNEVLPYIAVPRDDWPFLYLKEKRISSFYILIMSVIAIFAGVSVIFASEALRHGLIKKRQIDGEMFLFGIAFLLLETRSVTEMSLIWGATWITNAVVFGSILLMILLATINTKFRPLPFQVSAVGLVLSILISYMFPVDIILGNSFITKLLFSIILVGTPIYFASVCFANLFERRKSADIAFGWNLLGAVVGGLLEFLSMLMGLKALLLIALTAYLIAFLIRLRHIQSEKESTRRECCFAALNPEQINPLESM